MPGKIIIRAKYKKYNNKISYYDEITGCISKYDTLKRYDFKSCIGTKNKFNCNIKYLY